MLQSRLALCCHEHATRWLCMQQSNLSAAALSRLSDRQPASIMGLVIMIHMMVIRTITKPMTEHVACH